MSRPILAVLLISMLTGCGTITTTYPPTPPAGTGAGMPPPMGMALNTEEKNTCGITAEVTEGPYYVSSMGELTDGNLNYSNLPGTPLMVSGYVYEGVDTSKPLANTVVDIWQADNSGSYHPNANGPASNYTKDQLALRGYVKTDAQGYYSFTTVYPGEYTGRTRHIHIKVRAPNRSELTTQLIVPSLSGDQISFDEDTISRGLPNCHLLTIDGSKSPATTMFNFHLASN